MAEIGGYYSFIQYVPDRLRGEAANVGVIIFKEDPFILKYKIDNEYIMPRRFFHHVDEEALDMGCRNVITRLTGNDDAIQNVYDLQSFIKEIGMLANNMRVQTPRFTSIDHYGGIDATVNELYEKGVVDHYTPPWFFHG